MWQMPIASGRKSNASLLMAAMFSFVIFADRQTKPWRASWLKTHVGRESRVVQDHYLSSLKSAYTCDEVRAQLQAAGLRGLRVDALEDRYLTVGGRLRLAG